jgi:hypothetical protein
MQVRITYTKITITECDLEYLTPTDKSAKEGADMRWIDEWIEDESNRVKAENNSREEARRRKEEISSQSTSLWGSLQFWIREGVDRINKTPILRERVGSDLVFQELSTTSFEVRKSGYPLLVLTATRNGLSYKLNWRGYQSEIMARGSGVPGEDEWVKFDLDDDDELIVQNRDGDMLHQEALAEYILRRFLEAEK